MRACPSESEGCVSPVPDTSGLLKTEESTPRILWKCIVREWRPLQVARGHKALAVGDSALVDHGSVVGHLNGLADAGFASLHHAQFVGCVVHP